MNANCADRASSDMVEKSRAIPLTRDEIHLWLAFYDEITDVHLHSAYRELLNAEEKNQEQRFYFERDQRRYLITRALVRTVLSRYEPVHPREWIFSSNAYGRPEVANAPAKDSGLSFNISHTHSLIVMGVTRSRALGVDVENFRAREVSMDIADRYFAPQEVTALNAVPPHQQQYRFFEYWTFKEAYIKARGMGLSLRSISSAFTIRMIAQSRSRSILSWLILQHAGSSGSSGQHQNIWWRSVLSESASSRQALLFGGPFQC